MKQKRKMFKILRITLMSIVGLIVFSGIAIFLLLQNYMDKINLIGGGIADSKSFETDVYYDGSFEDTNGNTFDEEILDCNVDRKTIDYGADEEQTNFDSSISVAEDSEVSSEEGRDLVYHENYDTEGRLKELDQLIENNTSNQKKMMVDNNNSNILFIVDDTDLMDEEVYTDSIVLLSINQDKQVITAVSFSEDIYIKIPGYKNNSLKIAYLLGGAELLMETIQINFQIKIDRYIIGDNESFDSLLAIIDGDKLNVEKMNNMLNTILPRLTTNLNENEILLFLLMLPTYAKYDQKQYDIPLENTYDSFSSKGKEILAIDFDENMKELHSYLSQDK